ncbi:hypothetical protein D3C80_1366540 [compost metagenome]
MFAFPVKLGKQILLHTGMTGAGKSGYQLRGIPVNRPVQPPRVPFSRDPFRRQHLPHVLLAASGIFPGELVSHSFRIQDLLLQRLLQHTVTRGGIFGQSCLHFVDHRSAGELLIELLGCEELLRCAEVVGQIADALLIQLTQQLKPLLRLRSLFIPRRPVQQMQPAQSGKPVILFNNKTEYFIELRITDISKGYQVQRDDAPERIIFFAVFMISCKGLPQLFHKLH